MDKNIDIRTIPATGLTVRDSTDGSMKIGGYAVVFNQPSEDMGFIEYIDPKAFDGVDMSNVLLLYSHEFENVLARTDSNTLTIAFDDKGLSFEATLPNTTLARDTYENIKAGNVKGCSFGFTVADGGDDWEQGDGELIHRVTQIDQLMELSLTAIPAYQQTSVAVTRSLEKFKKDGEPMNKRENEEIKQLRSELDALKAKLTKRDDADDEKIDDEDVREDASAAKNDAKDAKTGENDVKKAADSDSKDGEKSSENDAKKSDETAKSDEKPAANSSDSGSDDKKDEKAPVKDEKGNDGGESSSDDDKKKTTDAASKSKQERSVDKMPKILKPNEGNEQKIQADFSMQLRDLNKRDAATDTSYTTPDAGIVIPEEIMTTYQQPSDPSLLVNYVNKRTTTSNYGHIPFVPKQALRLATKAELAENPKLEKIKLQEVEYKLQTYAGMTGISIEMTEDAAELASLISRYVQDATTQTENYQIAQILKSATNTATVKDFDSLKDAFYIGLTNYMSNVMWIVTASMYNEIGKLKDGNGQYLYNPDVTSASGQTLFGKPVVVIPDENFGDAGTKAAFVGDPYSFCSEITKSQHSVQWVRNESFEYLLAVMMRADFKKVDDAAGKFLTWNAASK